MKVPATDGTAASTEHGEIEGMPAADGFMTLEGDRYYRISHYDRIPPFLMNIASDTDLWMFVSSTGGLTAGRVDPDGAIFPYETVDKLHDSQYNAGPVTLIRAETKNGKAVLWEPFTENSLENFDVERNLLKNVVGDRLVFEEINRDLGLTLRYRWAGSERFGHVRTATLVNTGSATVTLSVLDGLRNILPCGAPLLLYQQLSSLVDAYKRVDCDPRSKLCIYSLTSRIIDRAEAAEELRANTVWCCADTGFEVSLSAGAVDRFRRRDQVTPERVLTGCRGNYLISMRMELAEGEAGKWHIAADAGKSHVDIAALRALILGGGDIGGMIEESLEEAEKNLKKNVATADGLQLTGSEEATAHHFANVLFNNMRGGVFADNYRIPAGDLGEFIRTRNRQTAERNGEFISSLPDGLTFQELIDLAGRSGDADLERLCHEYLPLYFGRRHGDPSRPWNRFSIRLKEGGRRLLRYEGNWRDIFQNWEALAASYPGFLRGMIAKFVNASTIDGFNPYRITREGIDWETVDPDDPWSYIGYWGDHQIIYLLRFLEAESRHYPGTLEKMLSRDIFSYADVPYRIRPYEKILENPYATVDYDAELAGTVAARVAAAGSDGRLVHGPDGKVYHVNLFEKLLVPVLAKLSSLVPDGGVWMNTQRPEWNDANNALVGSGISVVTLCHLRRHLAFIAGLLEGMESVELPVSSEVAGWFGSIESVFESEKRVVGPETIGDRDRKRILDLLGTAFSDYREKVYSAGFSGKAGVDTERAARFCRTAIGWLDHAIRANRRDDGLYHSYNLLELSDDGKEASVRHLYEMLEGQVAALGSGEIGPEEGSGMLEALFGSAMFREDQRSFMLYPERELPAFMEKNIVPEEKAMSIPLIRGLLEAGDGSIVERDADGILRFNGDLSNAADLSAALERLEQSGRRARVSGTDGKAVLGLFEEVFDHRSFTGRSGTMYGYEGLGCIYWHMVSKLLLAAQEVVLAAAGGGEGSRYLDRLADLYYRIRSGLCFEKTASEYGAFPLDPYSHTPPRGGARQPGMTGQVKEEILTRFGELGVIVKDGILSFRPVLLKRDEFLEERGEFSYYDLDGEKRSIDLPEGSLAFTFCQVPVIYRVSGAGAVIRLTTADSSSSTIDGDSLDRDLSSSIFDRLGVLSRIEVDIPEELLR